MNVRRIGLVVLLTLGVGCASSEAEAPSRWFPRLGYRRVDRSHDFAVDFGESGSDYRVRVTGSPWQRDFDLMDARLVLWDGREIAPTGRFEDGEPLGVHCSYVEFAFHTDMPRGELCSVAVVWSGERREVAIPER